MAPKQSPSILKKSSVQKPSLKPKSEGSLMKLSQSPIVYVELPPLKPNPIVFIDVKIGGEDIGQLLIEIFMHITPKTSENFCCLCTGEKGVGKQGTLLTYKKSKFYRIIPRAYAQGGDIIKNNGTGGESIYEGKPFEDENFQKNNSVVGSLAMCNTGPNSNESQFFINLAPNPDFDGRHVVFGQVKEESMHILKAIEAVGSWTGRPHQTVLVKRCGWANKKELQQMAIEEAVAKKKIEEEEAQKQT